MKSFVSTFSLAVWSSSYIPLFCGLLAGWSLTLANVASAQTTITPGLPSADVIPAYNLARTPLVSVILGSTTPGSTTSSVAASLQPAVNGVCSEITLLPATSSRSKALRTASTSATAAVQPVATVTLTYVGSVAGQTVWVQPLRVGGSLYATDNSGKVYDGSHGFYLTLGSAGTVTFSYQAPNQSGTYPVLTRYTNVKTVLPFLVPDLVP